MAKKIILHVVTGFLGAGKTTFIQAMMAELARRNEQQILPEKLVYVVNEFGQKGVDAAILEDSAVTSRTASFSNHLGCLSSANCFRLYPAKVSVSIYAWAVLWP